MGDIFKRFLVAFLFLLLLSSCTTHYLATWQNDDVLATHTDTGNFLVKNDTIGISHAFNRGNGNVVIRMENYTDRPILINLTKSAMTINGRTFNLVDGKSALYGRIDHSGNPEFGTIGFFDGEIAGKTNTLFIPPYAFAENEFTDIRVETRNIVGENFEGDWKNYPFLGYPVQTKVAYYERDTSPIILTSYLNYSILDRNNQAVKTDVITQNFYLAAFYKTKGTSRQEINHFLATREDMTSYAITKGQNTGLLLGLLGVGVLAAVVGPAEE